MWLEFGKIIYYSFKKDYPVPEKYYFVAPKECGTSFTHLLQNTDELKKEILAKWDKDVSTGITKSEVVSLTPELAAYINRSSFRHRQRRATHHFLALYGYSTCIYRR